MKKQHIAPETNEVRVPKVKKATRLTRKQREYLHGFLFIGLWLIGYLVFTFYPMIKSFYLTFTKSFYNINRGIYQVEFNVGQGNIFGFSNYINIARSQTLLPLFSDYLAKMAIAVPLIIVFSIMIAMLINLPIKGKGLWRTIFFLPVIISSGPVIAELSRQEATSLPSISESAALQFLFDNLGEWIARPIEALFASLLLILWYAGVPILIFLAGLQKIDSSVYEAASIDGASPWDRFWKITLPSIKPLISVAIIYVVVSMSLFVEPGGILELTRTHMLAGAPDNQIWLGYGYAATIAWIYFILMVLVMLIFIGLLSIKRKEVKRWG